MSMPRLVLGEDDLAAVEATPVEATVVEEGGDEEDSGEEGGGEEDGGEETTVNGCCASQQGPPGARDACSAPGARL